MRAISQGNLGLKPITCTQVVVHQFTPQRAAIQCLLTLAAPLAQCLRLCNVALRQYSEYWEWRSKGVHPSSAPPCPCGQKRRKSSIEVVIDPRHAHQILRRLETLLSPRCIFLPAGFRRCRRQRTCGLGRQTACNGVQARQQGIRRRIDVDPAIQ